MNSCCQSAGDWRIGCTADSDLRIRAQCGARLRREDRRGFHCYGRACLRAAGRVARSESGFLRARNCCWCMRARQSHWWRALRPRRTRMFPSMARRYCLRARQSAGDPWQIWELTLEDRSVRKLIAGAAMRFARSIFPAGGWSTRSARRWDFELESAGKDGHARGDPIESDGRLRRCFRSLTCRPARFPTDVLADGRILFEAGFPLGTGTTPELFLVYSDGSGVESYRCDHGRARWGGRQLAVGRCSVHARSDAGAFHFAAGSRGAGCAPHARVCRRDCGDGFGSMAGERAGAAWCALCIQVVEAGSGGARSGVSRERRGSCGAGCGCAAHKAQSPSFRAASHGITRICWRWMRASRARAI